MRVSCESMLGVSNCRILWESKIGGYAVRV